MGQRNSHVTSLFYFTYVFYFLLLLVVGPPSLNKDINQSQVVIHNVRYPFTISIFGFRCLQHRLYSPYRASRFVFDSLPQVCLSFLLLALNLPVQGRHISAHRPQKLRSHLLLSVLFSLLSKLLHALLLA